MDGDVEIWNLVFTQFNRVGNPPDNLRPLPSKNIDTGMGLERTAAVLQGVAGISNFENDLLKPLCLAAADVVGVKYDFHSPTGRPVRRIADHVRAATFALHEGVVPDKNNESYVIRQLVRRALLEGYLLGRKEPFLYEIVPAVVDVMKDAYPELTETVDSVQNTLKEEESQFLDTIDRGLSRFDKCASSAKSAGKNQISGDDAFTLHTEDGFLVELTEAIAADRGLTVDKVQYKVRMDAHEEVSRGGRKVDVMSAGPLDMIRKEHGDTEFVGYDEASCECKVVGLLVDKKSVENVASGYSGPIAVVLDRTPFYGESGGQVGDCGRLFADGVELQVTDCQKHQQALFVSVAYLKSGGVKVGDSLTAEVDEDRRSAIRRAHSGTHILHHALHQTIGETATQRGSRVEEDALRFDFAHKQAMTPDELRQVEDIINAKVSAGDTVTTELLPIKDARERGAMALFGEKYPDKVRVVTMGDFSVELCGGTHLTNTGQVGLFRITSEEPVAKGVRRITAVTGQRALQKGRETDELVAELQQLLKSQVKTMQKQLADLSKASVSDAVGDLVASAEEVDGVKIISQKLDNVTREALRDFVDQLRDSHGPIALVLGAEIDGKVALIAAVSKSLVKERKMNAGAAVKAAAQIAGGGGGGRPDMAEAGAKLVEKIDDALVAAVDVFKSQLS
ncbi:UNVERIFIED_CONTAM: hypothetical protein GTU68_034183 [Idotea baltica]|nr:hypothetical protein [Idotea baltica]